LDDEYDVIRLTTDIELETALQTTDILRVYVSPSVPGKLLKIHLTLYKNTTIGKKKTKKRKKAKNQLVVLNKNLQRKISGIWISFNLCC
jgi:hypothetical protein